MVGEVEANDFDIAKEVFDKLKDVPADRRKRILGWVAESLGVVMALPTMATHTGSVSAPPTTQMPLPGQIC